MPTATNAHLTLITQDQNTTIDVTYTANFSVFERHLAHLGLVFKERIRVIGVDPAFSTTGSGIVSFEAQNIQVTDGNVPQSINRTRSLTVLRSSLQEDPALGDTDEIRCRIRIAAIGLPPIETPDVFTNQETLPG
jgi:hypothetical protein